MCIDANMQHIYTVGFIYASWAKACTLAVSPHSPKFATNVAVCLQLSALTSLGKGHSLILLTTATPDAACTAHLQHLVDSTQACLSVTVVPCNLLTHPDHQATAATAAATAVALALQDMPPPQAVAVLLVSQPAVLTTQLALGLPAAPAASFHSVADLLPAAPAVSMHSVADPSVAVRGVVPTRDSLLQQVAAAAAQAIGEDVPRSDEPLMDAGLNSSGAVQLVAVLEAMTGLELPGTLAFDYPSIAEVADYLFTLQQSDSNTAGPACTAQQASSMPEADVATAVHVPILPGKSCPASPAVQPLTASAPASSPLQVTKIILAAVADMLSLDDTEASTLSLDAPLMDAGLNFTLAIQLTSQLESLLHQDLPDTLVFDYPTVRDIAGFVAASYNNTTAPTAIHSAEATNTAGSDQSKVSQSMMPQADEAVMLEGLVARLVTDITGDAVDPSMPLMDARLTSAAAIQLTTALEETLGIDLPGTLIFDYPTVSSLVAYLAGCGVHLPVDHTATSPAQAAISPALPGGAPSTATAVATIIRSDVSLGRHMPTAMTFSASDYKSQAVAIVASAHQVPGGTLQPMPSTTSVDRISPVPLERWNNDAPALDNPSELNAGFGSFLGGADQFDPVAFHLSASEATLMDPQQRLLLQTFAEAQAAFQTWNSHAAVADRHVVEDSNVKQQMGVYVGVSQLEYARITYETGTNLNAYYATGAHLSVTSGRIAYTFGLKGPAMAGRPASCCRLHA